MKALIEIGMIFIADDRTTNADTADAHFPERGPQERYRVSHCCLCQSHDGGGRRAYIKGRSDPRYQNGLVK